VLVGVGVAAGCARSVVTRGATVAATVTDGRLGGNASATAGVSWFHAHGGLDVRPLTRPGDPDAHTSVAGEARMAVSGLGVFDRSHRLEPYVDLGMDAGVAVGALHVTRLRLRDEAFAGAWLEVGLPYGPYRDQAKGYPTLVAQVRATQRGGEWDRDLSYFVGLGWRMRTWETMRYWD